jgi:large subunit ribosomal protein L13
MEYHIDATKKPLGRLASEVALILQGKKHPHYDPRLAGDDVVVISNISSIALTGKKKKEKKYYRHTGYVGHLKVKTFEEEFAKQPERVLREAVRRMLPKNFLNKRRLTRLRFTE